MQLQHFIAGVLKEIVDGVGQAQTYYSAKGGAVNAKGVTFSIDNSSQMWQGDTGQPVPLVEFDLAVGAVDGQVEGVFVETSPDLNGGASRIKFAVPILLPVSEY